MLWCYVTHNSHPVDDADVGRDDDRDGEKEAEHEHVDVEALAVLVHPVGSAPITKTILI